MAIDYTQQFRLAKPDFRTSPWSSYLNDNADRIDTLIYNALQANDISIYENATAVVVGRIMYDPDLNNFWVNNTAHTTEAAGTFADERIANPYWVVIHFAWTPKGQWQNGTVYNYYDVVYDPDTGLTVVCIEPHTSAVTGTLEDALSKWVIIADGSAIDATLIAFDNTGTSVAATNIHSAIAELDADVTAAAGAAVQLANDLSDLPDKAAARRSINVRDAGFDGTIVETHASGAVTFTVKTALGNTPTAAEPARFTFPNGSGSYDDIFVTAALSITIPSGATLSFVNSIGGRIWIAAFNDVGTVRLAVRCCSNATGFIAPAEWLSASSTLTPSNGGNVFYTTGAAVTAKYWVWIAFATYESGLAAAGTWNVSPSNIALVTSSTPRPGTVLQEYRNSTSQNSVSNTSTTPVASTHTLAVTMTSAANILKASCYGHIYLRGGVANQTGFLVIYIDGIDKSGLSGYFYQNTTADALITVLVRAMAKPNKTTSLNVVPYYYNSIAQLVQYTIGDLTVQEIMG